MKPFSPLKPLIAAMFALAAATAGAQVTVTSSDLESANYSDFANFGQLFTFTQDSDLNSWTFFGTQSDVWDLGSVTFNVGIQPGVTNVVEGATVVYSADINGQGSGWTFSNMSYSLAAGSYYAVLGFEGNYGTVTMNPVSGTVPPLLAYYETGTTGDDPQYVKSFQHDYAYTVTAVPEPEAYAMLLAGLGLMGAIARRRSRKV